MLLCECDVGGESCGEETAFPENTPLTKHRKACGTSPSNPGDIPRNMDSNPGHFAMYNVPLRYVIEWAYNLKDFEISEPEWIKAEERYDIVAKAEEAVSADKIRAMVQALIRDRFQMKSHTEKKEISCYMLMPGRGAAKLKEAAADGQPTIRAAVQRQPHSTISQSRGLLSC